MYKWVNEQNPFIIGNTEGAVKGYQYRAHFRQYRTKRKALRTVLMDLGRIDG